MMVSTVAQAEPAVELYHTNRPFTAIEFNWQGNLTSDQLEGEAGRITDIVQGEPIGIFMQVGREKETTVALGYDSGSNAWQAAVEAWDYVSPQGHWDKTFDNVGWTMGTKLVGTNWTAYIWSLQNGIDFYTSWSALWPDENGMFMITNVMVGSLGDYPPMTEVWDIGPDLSPAHSDYPGDNQSVEKIFKADLTAYYQVAPAGIMITPGKAVAPVGGEALIFTASGLTQYGVEWMMYPDGGPDGAWLEPDGNAAYVWPGTVPGIYQIYAMSSAYPQFYAEAELDVVNVELVSVDATDDIGPTKINYRVIPSGASIPSMTFTAPGMTETRVNVSGDFYFTYNQSDLAEGENFVRLSYSGCNIDITVTKSPIPKGSATEIAVAWMPAEPGYPPVPYAISHEIIAERYYRITYTVPVISGSRTLLIGSSDVRVETDAAHPMAVIIEKHRYDDSEGSYCNKDMTMYTGDTIPQTTNYRKFFESSDNKFMKPNNGLKGIAKIWSIAFDEESGLVYPIWLENSEADQNLE